MHFSTGSSDKGCLSRVGRGGALLVGRFAPTSSNFLSLPHLISRARMRIKTNDAKELPLQHLGLQCQSHKDLGIQSGDMIESEFYLPHLIRSTSFMTCLSNEPNSSGIVFSVKKE